MFDSTIVQWFLHFGWVLILLGSHYIRSITNLTLPPGLCPLSLFLSFQQQLLENSSSASSPTLYQSALLSVQCASQQVCIQIVLKVMTPVRNVLGFHSLKCTLLHFRHAAAICLKPKKQQGKMGEKYLNSKLCNNKQKLFLFIFSISTSQRWGTLSLSSSVQSPKSLPLVLPLNAVVDETKELRVTSDIKGIVHPKLRFHQISTHHYVGWRFWWHLFYIHDRSGVSGREWILPQQICMASQFTCNQNLPYLWAHRKELVAKRQE